MTTKKPTTGKKKPVTKKKPVRKPPASASRRTILPGLIVAGAVLLLGLFLLVRQPAPDYDERPAPRTIEDLIPTTTAPQSSSADLQVAVELILWKVGIDLRKPHISYRQGVRTFKLESPFPAGQQLQTLISALQHLPGEPQVTADAAARRVSIDHVGDCRFLLEFSPLEPPHAPRPRIALIVDDLGRDLRVARRLLALNTALTFSILPSESYARRVAELVHDENREVLIHLPMEPLGYPDKNPGDDALLVNMSADELRVRLDGFVEQVPYAVGGNNHMGSRFTEDSAGMQVVVDYLRDKQLFFVDSLTSHRSVAMETARSRQVPTAVRDVFLDNVPEVAAIAGELRKLVRVARQRGRAIGICHPYPETLAALEQELPLLSDELEFVPVSALLLH